jgi:hypothetical protein
MKHIACSDSASVFLPAANLIIVVGNTMRAVAIVRISVWYGTALKKNQQHERSMWYKRSSAPRYFRGGFPGLGQAR